MDTAKGHHLSFCCSNLMIPIALRAFFKNNFDKNKTSNTNKNFFTCNFNLQYSTLIDFAFLWFRIFVG